MSEHHPQIFPVGVRIAGRYEVERLIGRGGLAEVYLVRHVDLGSYHALKVLLIQRPSVMQRFLTEGRIQAQLRHPNVVQVTDILRHDGRHALLMEYVDNLALDAFVARKGALPYSDALEIMAPVMAGVHAAHKAGVLHRDLKPANILLARTPTGLVPKVTDFGIAKVVSEGMDKGRTRDGVAMGTPGYMAPEQVLDSKSVDARTDVFALAAVAYELMSGKRAFVDEHGEVSLKATIEGRVTPLKDLVPDVPQHVSDAICGALSREREDRPADILHLSRALLDDRQDLRAWVEGAELAKPVIVDLSLPSTLSNPGQSVRSQPTYTPSPTLLPGVDERQRQPLWPLIALGATAAVVVGVVAMLLVIPALRQTGPAASLGDVAPGDAPAVGTMHVTEGSTETKEGPNESAGLAPTDPPIDAPGDPPTDPPVDVSAAVVIDRQVLSAPVAQDPDSAIPEEGPPIDTDEAEVGPDAADAAVADLDSDTEPVDPDPPAPSAPTIAAGSAFHGTVYGQPLSVRIVRVSGQRVVAEGRLSKGASHRVIEMNGSFAVDTGRLELFESGGSTAVKGDVQQAGFVGSFYRGKRGQPITLTRE